MENLSVEGCWEASSGEVAASVGAACLGASGLGAGFGAAGGTATGRAGGGAGADFFRMTSTITTATTSRINPPAIAA